MNNHVHFIWQALESFTPTQNHASFMKFTARQLLLSLLEDDKDFHALFKVSKYDCDYMMEHTAGTWRQEQQILLFTTYSLVHCNILLPEALKADCLVDLLHRVRYKYDL